MLPADRSRACDRKIASQPPLLARHYGWGADWPHDIGAAGNTRLKLPLPVAQATACRGVPGEGRVHGVNCAR
jgi:hypothetical protein